MSETPPDETVTTTWASRDDVIAVLGNLGPRIAATSSVNLDEHLAIGHAEARSLLARTYVKGLPTWRGPALEVVRWAVAKLAAARVLDILRASLDTTSELPERLRASAHGDLTGALPGYPAGADLDDDGQPLPPRPAAGPKLGYGAPGSAFPDPAVWPW